jgi:thioesterase domain-containing protein
LINGLDPLYVGNMAGERDYLQQLGFSNIYFGQMYDWWWFKSKVRQAYREDPQARFVIVGYSWGCSMAHSLARAVQDEGIEIDLLVHLDAVAFTRKFHHKLENVHRVLNITSFSMLCGVPSEGAENIRESDVWHFGPPTHPRTLEALAANLVSLAVATKTPEARAMSPAAGVALSPAPTTTLRAISREQDKSPEPYLGER